MIPWKCPNFRRRSETCVTCMATAAIIVARSFHDREGIALATCGLVLVMREHRTARFRESATLVLELYGGVMDLEIVQHLVQPS